MTYASWGARAIARAPQEACPRLGAMSGCSHRFRPRGLCRGAALTLVFGCVLATGAATGSLPQDPDPLPELPARTVASSHAPVDRAEIEDAAARAEADGKSVKEAAGEVVSRSGDRWGAVYDEREYEEFEQALDGSYLGVGLSARRTEGGGVAVSRVQPGGPADRAGIREGDLLRTIDGRRMDRRPVPEVVALLRGDGTGAGEGTSVVLGLVRDGKPTTQILKRARLTPEAVTVSRLGTGPRRPTSSRSPRSPRGAARTSGTRSARPPRTPGYSWTSVPTPEAWSPRPSPPPPPSWTAAWSPPTTSAARNRPSTPTPAATPSARWWSSSTAAR